MSESNEKGSRILVRGFPMRDQVALYISRQSAPRPPDDSAFLAATISTDESVHLAQQILNVADKVANSNVAVGPLH